MLRLELLWVELEGNHPTFTKNDNKIVLNERATGSDVYAELREAMGRQKKASRFLSLIGFTGISYPAEFRSGCRSDGARNFVIFSESDAQITDHVRFFRTANGEAYGFTVDGKIYLDPRIATAETPIHEYTHLWADALRRINPKEWQNVVGLMKDTPLWDEIKNRYPELKTDDEIADEVLAHYSGKRGAERLREEQRRIAKGDGSILDKANAIAAIQNVRDSLAKFWEGVADWLGIHFTSAEEVADKVLADLLNGVNPVKHAKVNGNPRFQFVGEKGAANMDKAEEATTRLDNLAVAREMEQAFEEKKQRIEKLRKSEPVEITGNEIESSDDLKQYKKNALEYGKRLQGSYTNKDTGRTIQLQRGRKNGGLKEVLQHDTQHEDAQIKSVAAIPSIIENAVYIDSSNNEDVKRNPNIVKYHYYVCGLKIGGEDYTVRMVEAEEMDGSRYYDHKLSRIEKGKLMDELALINLSSSPELSSTSGTGTEERNRPTNRGETQSVPVSNFKDRRLFSLLLMNEQENARKIKMATGWERGADGKWRYEMMDGELKHGWEKKASRVQGAKLSEVIDNKPLFDAYPELSDYTVSIENLGDDVYGEYRAWHNMIALSHKIVIGHKNILLHEVQHAIQDIEGFARGGNMDTPELKDSEEYRQWKEMLEKMRSATEKEQELYSSLNYYIAESEKLEEMLSSIQSIMAEIESEQNNRGKKVQAMLDAEKSVLQRLYKRLAGEVEARNVQSRMDMTEEERKRSLAAETEDVAREDQIFIMDGINGMEISSESRLYREEEAEDGHAKTVESDQSLTKLSEEAEGIASSLNTPIRIIHDVNEITDEDEQRQARMRDSKGWYDTNTGEVVVVLPNTTNIGDVQATLMHEVVGHKGLRGLLGDKMGDMLDLVFKSAPADIRKKIAKEAVTRHGGDIRVATEEYLASIAERGVNTYVRIRLHVRSHKPTHTLA